MQNKVNRSEDVRADEGTLGESVGLESPKEINGSDLLLRARTWSACNAVATSGYDRSLAFETTSAFYNVYQYARSHADRPPTLDTADVGAMAILDLVSSLAARPRNVDTWALIAALAADTVEAMRLSAPAEDLE